MEHQGVEIVATLALLLLSPSDVKFQHEYGLVLGPKNSGLFGDDLD